MLGRELARLIAGYVCLHSAMAGTRMAAPLLALTLDYDKTSVGVLLALFALPQVLFALPAGRWADRRGVRIPVRASVAIGTVGGLAAAASPTYPVLCVTAVCAGAGIAAASIALQRHVGRTAQSHAELKSAFGWLSMAPALSNFVGPFVTGIVIDHAGYRTTFLMLAVLPMLGWLWIRSTRESATETPVGAESASAWSLWRDPGFRHLLVLNWLTAASFDVHGFVVPVLGHERGLSASAIGTILGAFAAAAALVRIIMPALTASVREWKVITAAMTAAALSFFLYALAHTAFTMALCSAAIGLSVGCVQPLVMSLLHQITPPHRHGEAVAMRLLMLNASSVAMPVLFGAAGGVIGVGSLFWLMGLAIGAGSPLSIKLRGLRVEGRH